MILDLLRVGLSPFLVAGASIASRKWGDAVGGWLAGFPFVAGPILLVVALEQGCPFAGAAARTALLGVDALVVFALWFAFLCRHRHWIVALVTGWAVYVAAAWIASFADLGVALNLVVVGVVLVAGTRSLGAAEPEPPRSRQIPSAFDIPARMLATLVLVCSITLAAKHLGPRWSGLLTPFPVATTVLSVFAHRSGGASAVTRFLRGFLPGLGSLAVFFAVVAWTLPVHGLEGFAWALASALAVHLVIAWARRPRGA